MKNRTRRAFLTRLSALPLVSHWSFAFSENHGLLYTGTYTKGSSQGIYAYRWDPVRGALGPEGLAAKTSNPSFLALAPGGRHLYSVNEIGDFGGGNTGSVSAFEIDLASGKLTFKNAVSSAGSGPCNVSVDHTGKAVFVADFAGGSLGSFRVLPGGGLSEAVSSFHYPGPGADVGRQQVSHIHCATVAPGNRHLLVNDLGLNRILVFHLDADNARLTPNTPAFYKALPGVGPRNLAFHPSGSWAYSVNEMGNTVEALAWDDVAGTLTRFQSVSTLPEGFHGSSTAATVAVDAAGRHLYASNRGADTIAVFSIDPVKGTLAPSQQISCGGRTPRHFALDPSNRWLLVANQDSGNIVIFARDARTGHLHATGRQVALDSPVCVAFA